tara:strand:+ start:2236 stop:2835 length:600 start_codon:yes stop_codon:yes gene_type:complete
MNRANLTEVQQFANSLGVGLTIDGRNGYFTRRFVKMFQDTFQLGGVYSGVGRLVGDGIPGPKTLDAMRICRAEGGRVSRHFLYKEFRNKGPLTPTVSNHVIRLERELVAGLERLRKEVGPIHIASGYRSPAHNNAVGGVRNSQHVYGRAVDLHRSRMSGTVSEKAARAAGFSGVGIESRSNPSVIHVDVRPTPTRWYYR